MKTTEQDSFYNDLNKMSTLELVESIHKEDEKVAAAVGRAIPQIKQLIDAAYTCMIKDGRLLYMGAGTSGRLGILDASECTPTFGIQPDKVIGIIAGGDAAIKTPIENAEDDKLAGIEALKKINISINDFVIGITASGYNNFVYEAMQYCANNGIPTGCITANMDTPISKIVAYPIEILTGPEFLTGSTRMKAGTAQKMVLNMISTSIMIKLGHVEGNKMIHLMPVNEKLRERSINIIAEKTGINDRNQISALLLKYGNIPAVLKFLLTKQNLFSICCLYIASVIK